LLQIATNCSNGKKEKEREKEARRRAEEKMRPSIAVQISRPSYNVDLSKKIFY
jgi:hypothetical protein